MLVGDVSQAVRLAAAEAGGAVWVLPRCVAPPTIDGNTRVAAAGASVVHPGLRRVVEQIVSGRVDQGRSGVWVGLGHGLGRVNVRVSGLLAQTITLEWPGEAWVRISRLSGEITAQARAEFLWSHGAAGEGWARWCDRYLAGVFGQVFGVSPSSWRVTNLEVCADFVGWVWATGDQAAVLGVRGRGGGVWGVDGSLWWAQTVRIGRRGSSIAVCLYDKTNEMKNKPGHAYVYKAVHVANGWLDGQRVQRVEYRLAGQGLALEGPSGSLELRDPWKLSSVLAELWAVLAYKRRMVVADTATRRARCEVDPRWLVVQAAGAVIDPSAYKQATREASEQAWRDAFRRASCDLVSAVCRIGQLAGAEEPELTSECHVGVPLLALRAALRAWETAADRVGLAWERSVDRLGELRHHRPLIEQWRWKATQRTLEGAGVGHVAAASTLARALAALEREEPLLSRALGAEVMSHVVSAVRAAARSYLRPTDSRAGPWSSGVGRDGCCDAGLVGGPTPAAAGIGADGVWQGSWSEIAGFVAACIDSSDCVYMRGEPQELAARAESFSEAPHRIAVDRVVDRLLARGRDEQAQRVMAAYFAGRDPTWEDEL